MEAAQVSVIVLQARNLLSKKRDACIASVVFGIGNDLFGTEVVESNEPVWNQEAQFDVSKKPHGTLKFKIRDKDTTIGAVHIPIDSLPTVRPGHAWHNLEAYKKVTSVQGQLCLECWISKSQPSTGAPHETAIDEIQHYVSSQVSHVTSQVTHLPGKMMDYLHLNKRSPNLSKHQLAKTSDSQNSTPYSSSHSLRQTLEEEEASASPKAHRPLKAQSSDTSLTTSSQKSEPIREEDNVSSASPPAVPPSDDTIRDSEPEPASSDVPMMGTQGLPMKDIKPELEDQVSEDAVPEISGVSPNESTVDGGTKVTLRGANFGSGPKDIVKVVVAGVDCTETLEYISPVKILVTTLPSEAGPTEGPIIIETHSGGESVSTLMFNYIKDSSTSKDTSYTARIQTLTKVLESPFVGNKRREDELQAELRIVKSQLKDLKEENVTLKEDNKSLQEYINKLLPVVMEKAPEVLASN